MIELSATFISREAGVRTTLFTFLYFPAGAYIIDLLKGGTYMFIFTEDYKLGITTIDEEHEKLVGLLNDAIERSQDKDLDLPSFAAKLKSDLQDYANTHFSHEEAYMEKIQDPELPRQQKEHQAFMKKVTELPTDDSMTLEKLQEIMEYWVRWLFSHILHTDMMIGKMEPDAEDIFAFTDKYKTGIDFVDEQHQVLFDIIREANNLVQKKMLHDKYDEILDILDELHDYTEKHFRDEEDYMKKVGYPGLSQQKKAHSVFIDRLVKLDIGDMDFIDEHQQEYLEDLIIYLLDWLTHHILMEDKAIGKWVKNKGLTL